MIHEEKIINLFLERLNPVDPGTCHQASQTGGDLLQHLNSNVVEGDQIQPQLFNDAKLVNMGVCLLGKRRYIFRFFLAGNFLRGFGMGFSRCDATWLGLV